MGFEIDIFVGSSLIKVYADNGCIDNARALFDKIPCRDNVLWNVMLTGYVKYGDTNNSVEMFLRMISSDVKPNSVTFASMLYVCASEALIGFSTQLHELAATCALDLDSIIANTLLARYSKCQ